MNKNSSLKKPPWLARRLPGGGEGDALSEKLRHLALHTVCQSADCPNIGECFAAGTATFLILGGVCTRNCRFCAVPHGKPAPLDQDEPGRLLEAVRYMQLPYVVITSVTRDDLPDGGAGQFAACVKLLRKAFLNIQVEVLIPDLLGKRDSLEQVFSAGPDVLNHNIETVSRLYPQVRPAARYERSLDVLRQAAEFGGMKVKSGLMLGLGESKAEVETLLGDLRAAGVTHLTVGQYLAPSQEHYPVSEYIHPEQFLEYERTALALGFKSVFSGPLVRSSYRASCMA